MLKKVDVSNVDFEKVKEINELLLKWHHELDFKKNEDVRTLEMIIDFQDEDGLFKCLTDFAHDKDFDAWACLYPTYLCTSIWIKAINYNSDYLFGREKELAKALDACTIRGLSNPEIYIGDAYIDNLKLFTDVNVSLFLSNYSYLSDKFTEMIIDHYNYYKGEANSNLDAKLIARKLETSYNVFVYGTLLKGQRNHDFLKNAEFISEAYIENYAIFDLGYYPGIKEEKGKLVKGELYRVDLRALKELDRLECNGSLYNRIEVNCNVENGGVYKCFTYLYNGSFEDNKEIPYLLQPYSSCWNEEHVWYVSYGSNLYEDRFMCYLTGESLEKYEVKANQNRMCSNQTKPKQQKLITIPYELYFGGSSRIWEGKGTAFLNYKKRGKTIGKAYLITKSQYEHIKRFEGLNYQYEVKLQQIEGINAVTFTSKTVREYNEPSIKYKNVLVAGLLECGLSVEEAKKYINEKCENKYLN